MFTSWETVMLFSYASHVFQFKALSYTSRKQNWSERLDEQDMIFFPVINKTWLITIVHQKELTDMYMLVRENWAWCMFSHSLYAERDKKWNLYCPTLPLLSLCSASPSASHPILCKWSIIDGQKLIFFYLGGNFLFFSDFAFILHWNKRQNYQNSPHKGVSEECHLRILFQKEIKVSGWCYWKVWEGII